MQRPDLLVGPGLLRIMLRLGRIIAANPCMRICAAMIPPEFLLSLGRDRRTSQQAMAIRPTGNTLHTGLYLQCRAARGLVVQPGAAEERE